MNEGYLKVLKKLRTILFSVLLLCMLKKKMSVNLKPLIVGNYPPFIPSIYIAQLVSHSLQKYSIKLLFTLCQCQHVPKYC